ncbi:MAG: helix-turn-helix domain-containing protein [Treponema sp.]|nr:helix-turn-helix domain-containing protein [Treponema sp.]
MTSFQKIFIKNLRFWRKKRGFSQLKLSELLNISPNYLNAVENGKNFPSPEVIQNITDILEILPHQLFFDHPVELKKNNFLTPDLIMIKQRFIDEINTLIEKCENEP